MKIHSGRETGPDARGEHDEHDENGHRSLWKQQEQKVLGGNEQLRARGQANLRGEGSVRPIQGPAGLGVWSWGLSQGAPKHARGQSPGRSSGLSCLPLRAHAPWMRLLSHNPMLSAHTRVWREVCPFLFIN